MQRDPAGALPKRDKVFALEPGTIEELTVRATGGETTALKKTGSEWQITAPATVDADDTAVSTITSSLESLEIQRVVDDNPSASGWIPSGSASPSSARATRHPRRCKSGTRRRQGPTSTPAWRVSRRCS
jgi:hypothetical protein